MHRHGDAATGDVLNFIARMARRLRRPQKAAAAVVQLGLCAYCGAALPEAFEVDHMMRVCPRDDRPCNLAATCGTCHNTKSMLERIPNRAHELQRMVEVARGRKDSWLFAIKLMSDDELVAASLALPRWLQHRAPAHAILRRRRASMREPQPPSAWESLRYLSR